MADGMALEGMRLIAEWLPLTWPTAAIWVRARRCWRRR